MTEAIDISLSAILLDDNYYKALLDGRNITITTCLLPAKVRDDMACFLEQFDVTQAEFKRLNIRGVRPEDTKKVLSETYL